MFKINRITQVTLVIIYLVIVLINTADDPRGMWEYATLFGVLALLPIGITQLIGSVFAHIEYGKKSPLRIHFQLMKIVLGLFLIALLIELFTHSELAGIFGVIAFFSSIGLMLYYWYVIFYGYKKPIPEMLNLFDKP